SRALLPPTSRSTLSARPADCPPSDKRGYGCRGVFASASGNQSRDAHGFPGTLPWNRSFVLLPSHRARLCGIFGSICFLLVHSKIRPESLGCGNRGLARNGIS